MFAAGAALREPPGATLRRDGKPLEAYELFRKHLERATLPNYIHERARLYGNYGALLDQLGQRAAADDGYARLEELCELLGNPDRLANARGLAARSADLRQDQETALRKYEDERRLAEQSGNVARQVAATLHMARMNGKLKRFRIAEKQCEEGPAGASPAAIRGVSSMRGSAAPRSAAPGKARSILPSKAGMRFACYPSSPTTPRSERTTSTASQSSAATQVCMAKRCII